MGLFNNSKKLTNFVPWRARPGTMFLHKTSTKSIFLPELSTKTQPLDIENNSLWSITRTYDTYQIIPIIVQETNLVISDERIYDGSQITSLTNSLLSFRATTTGNIIEVYLWIITNTNPTSAIFNLRQNGSQVWTGSNRLIITQDSGYISKLNLSIPCILGDLFELSVDQIPGSGIFSPVILLIKTSVT